MLKNAALDAKIGVDTADILIFSVESYFDISATKVNYFDISALFQIEIKVEIFQL